MSLKDRKFVVSIRFFLMMSLMSFTILDELVTLVFFFLFKCSLKVYIETKGEMH